MSLRPGPIGTQGWEGTLGFSGWAGAAAGSRAPEPWPQDEDTLLGGGLDVLSWGRGAGHLLSVGKLGQQPQAEVFSPLILLPSVDEDLVLQVRRTRERIKYEEWRGNWGAWSRGSRCPPQTKCNTPTMSSLSTCYVPHSNHHIRKSSQFICGVKSQARKCFMQCFSEYGPRMTIGVQTAYTDPQGDKEFAP